MPGRLVLPVTVATLLWWLGSMPASAAGTRDRVALILSGGACDEQREAIRLALLQSPGVTHVDMTSVPDHVLIDRTRETSSPEALAALVNSVLPTHGSCRADIMRSCITAGAVERDVAP